MVNGWKKHYFGENRMKWVHKNTFEKESKEPHKLNLIMERPKRGMKNWNIYACKTILGRGEEYDIEELKKGIGTEEAEKFISTYIRKHPNI